jgi:FkbM family methyltransferase
MKVDWSRHRSFVYGTWEPDVVHAITDVVRPGACAIDIGAHIGFYTLILAKMVGPYGRVLAFEPLPRNFSLLCDNIRLNNCTHVQAIDKAVLDHTCDVEADIREDGLLPGSVVFRASERLEQATASAVSIDDFVHDSGLPVSIMKIDVEGNESLVLKGASRTIQSLHPTMIIEVHHFDASPDASPVISQLRERGYSIRWLSRETLTSHLLAI